MSTQTLLRVSCNDADAITALAKIIPGMEAGFNINAVHGDISINGDDAKAMSQLLSKLLLDRIHPQSVIAVPKKANPDLKKALNVLKSVMSFASRDWPKSLNGGEAVFQFDGQSFTYNSIEGATVGVTLPPGQAALASPVHLPVKLIKAALFARPGHLAVDPDARTINGVKFDPDFRFDGVLAPLDVHRHFASVKTIVDVPLGQEISGVRMAEGQDDIRYWLNGLCFDLGNHALVATNGHRMHVANSATLPSFDSAVLNELLPKHPEDKRLIIPSWQMQLFNVIGATELKVGRFPDHPKGTLPLPGWGHPDENSQALLVRAVGPYGFFAGKSMDASYPDWRRVLESSKDVSTKRTTAKSLEAAIEEQLSNGDPVSQTMLAWRADYPRTVQIDQSAADDLRRYIRAEKASGQSVRTNPLVIVDLKAGQVVSVEGAFLPLKIELSIKDHLEYAADRDDHLIGVQASYLADAIEYLGSTEWTICKSATLTGSRGALSAVVMPCKL